MEQFEVGSCHLVGCCSKRQQSPVCFWPRFDAMASKIRSWNANHSAVIQWLFPKYSYLSALLLYCLISLLNSISIYGLVNLDRHIDNSLHHHAVVTHFASSTSSCPFLNPFFLTSFISPLISSSSCIFFRALFLSLTYIPLLFFSSFCLPTSSIWPCLTLRNVLLTSERALEIGWSNNL